MTRAESTDMIRIVVLLAAAVPLTACIGPSRSPGRLGGTLVTLTGAALAFNGATTDCEAFGCVGTALQTNLGVTLLVAGVSTLIINELRYLPPAVEEPPRRLPQERRAPTNRISHTE
jgi:hypothetical protein